MSEHGYCDKCGEDLGDHPTVNVEGINTLALCQDRAIKWKRVEPGTVIPAGQPYRKERENWWTELVASELVVDTPTVTNDHADWFIDSSWKPPLVLPTEPTWGIALCRDWHRGVSSDGWILDRWHLSGEWFRGHETASEYDTNPDEPGTNVLDFIELTPEQVARVEAAR